MINKKYFVSKECKITIRSSCFIITSCFEDGYGSIYIIKVKSMLKSTASITLAVLCFQVLLILLLTLVIPVVHACHVCIYTTCHNHYCILDHRVIIRSHTMVASLLLADMVSAFSHI